MSAYSLNKRFAWFIHRNWIQNNHSLKNESCVYAILSYDIDAKDIEVAYVGSTTALCNRYRSHSVPGKVQAEGRINILYYLPKESGFYDYEIKLIRKLQPKYNKQHRNVAA